MAGQTELFSAEIETSWTAPPRGKSLFAGLMDLMSAVTGGGATPTEVSGDPCWRVVLHDNSDGTNLTASPWSLARDDVERLRDQWTARLLVLSPEAVRAGAVLRPDH